MKKQLVRSLIVLVLTVIVVTGVYLTRVGSQFPADCGNITLTDYPVVGDGIADDAGAFRQAFEHLAVCGGGTLKVPAGRFAIKSTVQKNFLHRAAQIALVGNGSSSQIHIATGGTTDALVFQDVEVLIDKLMFVGGGIDGAGSEDALNAIHIQGGRGTIQRNHFVGLGAVTPGAATIRYDQNAKGIVQNNQFWGCRSNSAIATGTIVADNYTGLAIKHNKFLDYTPSFVNGNYYSTNGQAGLGWIVLYNPTSESNGSFDSAATVVIEDNQFDEGSYFAVLNSPSRMLDRMEFRRNSMNVGSGGGYVLRNIVHLKIEGDFSGWHQVGDQVDAVHLTNVQYATIKDFRFSPNTLANRLTIEARTVMLRLVDSPFGTILNQAQDWRIEDGASVTTSGESKLLMARRSRRGREGKTVVNKSLQLTAR